ncbi:nucleotide-diphospho-sugar transferase [Mycotypha africana]|uniref:nucleotide-diphospho-sugar transferase n=1 Tax=Mycotypha africana TaxID=64632 RepID=UPI0023014DE1|nr:nucleotide-diphospho-sugar transferase [Mycotypha africana]KAI8975702.1 nucleotide-diphospho-sugar transferase [Mycotypha africana]
MLTSLLKRRKVFLYSVITFVFLLFTIFCYIYNGNEELRTNVTDTSIDKSSHTAVNDSIQKIDSNKPDFKDKVRGCFVILIRNSELEGIVSTMHQVEKTFNNKFQYPYVFLNDDDFTKTFKNTVTAITNAKVSFGIINSTMWGYPKFINQTYAAETRETMAKMEIPYATSESYRHMCRFQSGFFFRHPLLDEFDFYWRLEPYTDYYCDIDYDVFRYMKENKKKYGFTIAYKEHIETVPTLWNTTIKFLKDNPDIAKKMPNPNESFFDFVTNDGGLSYNTCHFWSNFEIGDLSLWRSDAYLRYFKYLDEAGGFYYERWGDAPVHSIAAAFLLKKDEVHFFKDIGYRHTSYTHCPVEQEFRSKCTCNPIINFGK